MSYDRQILTEDCPLTKDKSSQFKLSTCCGGGLKIIVSSFIVLTIAVTAALIFQLLYSTNISQSIAGVNGAVATDYTNCSQIGTTILRKGGNAVDAAVAATLCMAVVAPEKTGLGGGGYMMIYNHRDQTDPLIIDFANNTISDLFAARSIRIPALLRGLEFAQTSWGNLPWYKVVKPLADLARNGFVVSKEFAYEISKNTEYANLYGNINPGEILLLPTLAETLDAVAEFGADVFYNGTVVKKFLQDALLSEYSLQELALYKPEVTVARKTNFYGYTIYYPLRALPLEQTLQALENLKIMEQNSSYLNSQILVAQSLVSSNFKYSKVDPNAESQRYASVVAMDWQDKYVSVVTGLSAPLGLARLSPAGFLLDGTVAGNTLASFAPVAFRDTLSICGLRGVFGSDDPTVIGELLSNLLILGMNASTAVEYPRYYLRYDNIAVESDERHSVDTMLQIHLDTIANLPKTDASLISKSVNVITKHKDSVTSHSDSRGGALASRYKRI
ncbi:glutathione hydrolase 7 [Cephus cinctus]|uniref:Glutathione hydrolase 7 n=1 Tax=Cephus cinctus TaxID=211228 RepID=A0AAJ7BYG1_CEPCN|nr:glutathione hydrolase 7 [Cephus cinctus]